MLRSELELLQAKAKAYDELVAYSKREEVNARFQRTVREFKQYFDELGVDNLPPRPIKKTKPKKRKIKGAEYEPHSLVRLRRVVI